MINRVGHQLGNYWLLRLLGHGGFADIYLGEHVYLKSLAALKILRMSLSEEERAAFLKEAQTLTQLTHPNIVRVLDFAVDDDQPYLVMDYAPNGSLRERHPAGSRLPMDSIVTYVTQVASALQFAHDKGFVHRDVKPENMLLGTRSEILLSDFGISVFASRTEPQYSTNHIAQSVAGTSRYMAPEQLQGHPQPASDQYALGVVVYEWLCGTSPFHGTLIEVAMQHLTMPPTPLREQVPELTPAIEEVVLRALSKDPEQRFTRVQDFAGALQNASLAASTPLTFPAPVEERKVLHSVLKTEPLWKVPTTFTSFIGREQDVAAIEAMLLRPEVRLLTLAGIGGIGKTSLAIQIASHMRSSFADGVCFVGLASTFDPALIPSIIAETLGIQQVGNLSIFDQVKLFLREKQLLLILDNFEQLVTAASLVEDLLAACPTLKIIVTSRIVLRLRAEFEYQVMPLTLPELEWSPNDTGIRQSTAVALFVQRAKMVNPNFQLTQSNAHTIAEICVQLDGLPLAIELAAARIRLLPPQALLNRLSKRFEVLTGGAVTLPVHQQTLRNTLKWSYDLLDAHEQQLFRRLAVFERGWTLEAAEALGNANREVQDDLLILDDLASLIDKSLLRQIEHEGTEPRFLMFMTVREYGLECLRENREEAFIRRAHADYYLALVEEAEPHLKGEQQLLWLRRLDREQENLRAALNWLITHEEGEKALRFCVALWWFWQTRGYWSEGRRWLKAALALSEARAKTSVRALALSAVGELAGHQTDWQEAQQLLSESMTIFKEVGDDAGYVLPMSTLGWVLLRQGDYAAAVPLMEDCLAKCRQLGRNWDLARVLLRLSNYLQLQGDLEQALTLTREALTLSRELGDRTLITHALNNLGYWLYLHGDLEQAKALAQEGLTLARELGGKLIILTTLETLGSIFLTQGSLEQAISCFTEGYSLSRELGNELFVAWYLLGLARVAMAQHQLKSAARLFAGADVRYNLNKQMGPKERDDHERMIRSVRARLGEQAFIAAWAEGRKMTPEQILAAPDELETPERVTLAITSQNSDQPPPGPGDANDLTPRELEVLRLVAQALTDAQIAEKLVISHRTVNAHLTSIYRKINVSSRSAATRYAFDRKLD
jgi:predicted ATPase/serine/threonine protein kinase/DNA-binding CsgD family transcriptional regulator/Tfp pilus assembly protein PilF